MILNIDEMLTLYHLLLNEKSNRDKMTNLNYENIIDSLLYKIKDYVECHGIFELKDGKNEENK